MIIRADTAVSFLIEFPLGQPDGNITWKLRNPSGTIIASGSAVIPANSVSFNLSINASYNALPVGALTTYRDVEWSYTVGGAIVNGSQRYTIEGRVAFGVSASGVRTKLGIDDVLDLPDDEVSLVSAYLKFAGAVKADNLAAADPSDIRVRDAIESLAALAVLPSLSVRLAKKEDSGTSSFQRQDIDWDSLASSLSTRVIDAYLVLDPTYDETAGFGAIFIVASPAEDAFTGTTA